MSNISMPYCPGPSFWYVSTGASGAFEYLGQAEGDTSVELTPEWDDIMIDGGGFRLPYDRQFMGESGSVSGNLSFYRETILQKLKLWLNGRYANMITQTGTAAPGVAGAGTIGTLARTESYRFQLVIQSGYATKAPYSANGMVGGFWFPYAVPVGSWGSPLSTRVKRERVAFDCVPLFDGSGGYTLYSNDLSSLTLPAPT